MSKTNYDANKFMSKMHTQSMQVILNTISLKVDDKLSLIAAQR